MDTFGRRLKLALVAKGMTQAALAEKVSRTKGAVTQWIHGDTEPDFRTLMEICRHLEVSADFLVRGVDTAFLDEQTVSIAARMQSLAPDQRATLHKLIFGNGASDATVEQRMPITKALKR